MSAARPLPALAPRRCAVAVDALGRPRSVDGRPVEAVREEWRVEQGWWASPQRRRYLEVVLRGGALCVLYEDRRAPGTWWRHGR
jgi:hypothetical protein